MGMVAVACRRDKFWRIPAVLNRDTTQPPAPLPIFPIFARFLSFY